jgi:hypothetical protein
MNIIANILHRHLVKDIVDTIMYNIWREEHRSKFSRVWMPYPNDPRRKGKFSQIWMPYPNDLRWKGKFYKIGHSRTSCDNNDCGKINRDKNIDCTYYTHNKYSTIFLDGDIIFAYDYVYDEDDKIGTLLHAKGKLDAFCSVPDMEEFEKFIK